MFFFSPCIQVNPYFQCLCMSSLLSVHIIPCRCIFSVPLRPSSVTSQCLGAFLCSFLQRSVNLLTPKVAISLSNSYPCNLWIPLLNSLILSLLNVRVTNTPFFSCLTSSTVSLPLNLFFLESLLFVYLFPMPGPAYRDFCSTCDLRLF